MIDIIMIQKIPKAQPKKAPTPAPKQSNMQHILPLFYL